MDTEESIGRKFTEALNTHGHVFQNRVLAEAERLLVEKVSTTWLFEVAEFPVKTANKSTHIDFILKSKHTPMHLVCECKRVNPAYGIWCFAQSPYIGRESRTGEFIADYIYWYKNDLVTKGVSLRSIHDNEYHLGYQIKSDERGDSKGSNIDAINDACTQVCIGVNGLIEAFIEGQTAEALMIPVIFTTARLWTTNARISISDLSSGKLNEPVEVREQSWIYYQYHQSREIIHEYGRPGEGMVSLSKWMDSHSVRTIVIVNANRVFEFLRGFSDTVGQVSFL